MSGFISCPYSLAPSATPTDQLTHRWPMDAAHFIGGSVQDVVGSLHGTAGSSVVATATGPDLVANSATTIPDDANGYIILPATPQANLALPWSLAWWCKRADYSVPTFQGAGTDPRLWSFYDGTIAINCGDPATLAAGQIEVGRDDNGAMDIRLAVALTNNVWSHVAYVWDGVAAKMYVNGALDAAAANADLNATPLNINSIGARDVANRPFGGDLHNLFFYAKALSLIEVQQLYAAL